MARAQAAHGTHVLIVTGSSGERRFAQQFHALAMSFRAVALERFNLPATHVAYLAESTSIDPRAVSGTSTRDGISRAVNRIASTAAKSDPVFILLIGHGSSDGTTSRFNVPGSDVSELDLRAMLDRLRDQTVAVVLAASASGEFVKALSGRNRVIITATKSGFERNESLFGQHFVGAYAREGADTDKDGRVSLLEAFVYARREVRREYESSNRLQTEHAMLDDDGDGAGRADPAPRGPDGDVASRFFLQPAIVLSAELSADPRVAALLAAQVRLEAQLDTLRMAKGIMPEADYQKALEDLLTRISENASALRVLGVKKP